MEYGIVLGLLHQLVGWLLYPVVIALGLSMLALLWEIGQLVAEYSGTLRLFQQAGLRYPVEAEVTEQAFQRHAAKRLERVDLLARSGPILGLMGTLIPLGPGLTALGSGNIDILATALTVAFDTTVIGLLIGLLAYVLGRVRRRWYDNTWQQLQNNLAIPVLSEDTSGGSRG